MELTLFIIVIAAIYVFFTISIIGYISKTYLKTLEEQQKLIDKFLNLLRESTEIINENTDIIKRVLSERKNILDIIKNADTNKETYRETLNKIKKELGIS